MQTGNRLPGLWFQRIFNQNDRCKLTAYGKVQMRIFIRQMLEFRFLAIWNNRFFIFEDESAMGNIAIRYVCDLVHGAASDGTHIMPLPKYAFLIF